MKKIATSDSAQVWLGVDEDLNRFEVSIRGDGDDVDEDLAASLSELSPEWVVFHLDTIGFELTDEGQKFLSEGDADER